ncbi:MAG: cobalamin B12-binding domain-containing protein [Candidatus Lindowbacteria bacterium]|nr:cobalamin B12-binding domain-containing protein [Candidatus Lindowbacteria bacterium]
MSVPIRVLVAKPGLDGHDKGARMVCRVLRDSGMEVIYTGLKQTPNQIVAAAIQEDVHIIGLSILSGAHLGLSEKVIGKLRDSGAGDKIVVVGGIILDEDIPKLKELGVAEVFPSGVPLDHVVEIVRALGEKALAR